MAALRARAPGRRELSDLLACCTVRIASQGRQLGTGFFVAPGKVLTAAHVVATSVLDKAPLRVIWQGTEHAVVDQVVLPKATVADPYPFPDTALLVVALTEHPCVQLENSLPRLGRPPDSLWSYGYTDTFAPGRVSGTPVGFSYEGHLHEQGGCRLQLKQGQVVGGMSGSALLNERTGKVCGIVTRSRETRRDAGAWAVPAGPALDQISGLMEAHKAFHAAERTWRVAREGQLRRQKTLLLRSPFSPLPAFEHTPPSFLLQATYGVVPFRGRVNELADAEEWCFGADQLACRLILGPGGTGKTRFAGELCDHMADRGWLTGFLEPNAGAEAILGLQALEDPGLVVVDYAETRSDLPGLLEAMARGPADASPLRLLLVARETGDWWHALETTPYALEAGLATASLRRLGAVDETVDAREEAFTAALQAFATALHQLVPRPKLPQLSRPPYDSMLFIHMAALIALEGVGIEAPHSARDQILKTILEREARYWDRTARRAKLDLDPALLRRAVAVATLAGARNESEAAALLAAVPDWTDATGGARRSVARWLERLYPGPDWLNPLQPDLLGEKLVATVLEELPELARAVLQIATDEAAHRALTVLTRAARHYEAGRAALSDVLDANLPTLASLAITLAARTGDPFAHEARNNVLAAPQWEPSPQFIQYDGSDEVAPGLTRARLELEVRIAIGEELPGKRLILKDGLVNASEPEAVAIQVRDSHLAGVSSGQAAALHSYYEARLQRIRRFEELVQSYGFRAISSLQAIDEFMATGSWPVDPFPGVVQDPLLRRAWIENVIRLLKEHPRTFKLALVDRQACPLMRRAYWEIVGDRCLFFGVVAPATTCALGHSFAPDVVAIFLGIFEDLWEALPSSSHDTRLVVARLERAIRHCPRQPRSAANQEAAPSRRI